MTEDPTAFLAVLRRKLQELTEVVDRYEKSLSPKAPTTEGAILDAFPEDLKEQLVFSITKTHHIIRPRQYLGSDTFRKVAAIVRDQLNGVYVSAGRDSHFRVPRQNG